MPAEVARLTYSGSSASLPPNMQPHNPARHLPREARLLQVGVGTSSIQVPAPRAGNGSTLPQPRATALLSRSHEACAAAPLLAQPNRLPTPV
jgi:hypothetical protein